jgi:hypothetical protein
MPDIADLTPIQAAWINFTTSVRALFVVQPDDRPLDQYLEFRDKVISLIESPSFLAEIETAWAPLTDTPRLQLGEALLVELRAFPRAMEVAKASDATSDQSKGFLGRWLPRASTVAGSVEDLMEGLPTYAKGALTLFKELCSLFKGKD